MIQLGLPPTMILGTDPNWDKHGHGPRGITRRFVLAMAIMSVALVALSLPLVLILISLVMPAPLVYQNVPFPICSPESSTQPASAAPYGVPQDMCLPLQPGQTFQPGDVVPLLATRCIQSVLNADQSLSYIVSRNVVSVKTNTRIILPNLAASESSSGCTTALSFANQLPAAISPGEYYIEGVATAYGKFKTVNAYWRTQVFTVSKPD